MNEPWIHPKKSTRIVVVPITKEYRKIFGQSVILECYCKLNRVKIRRSKVIKNILNEIKSTQSWKKDYRPTIAARLSLTAKLLIKSPRILRALLFRLREYIFIGSTNCISHSVRMIDSSLVWYSNSAARIGFPWSREVFLNSLNIVRNPEIGILIFSFSEVINSLNKDIYTEQIQSVNDKIQKNIYISIGQHNQVENNQDLVSWDSSKLCQFENAEILHGTVLLSNRKFIDQDNTNGPWIIPARMTPCSVWVDERLKYQNSFLLTPYTNSEITKVDSGLFINASNSFYHFISESIRPLIQALQANIYLPNIIIRDDLPIQFYELVKFISPNSNITLAKKGELIIVNNLLAGIIEERLSRTNSVFSEYSLKDLKLTDEWRVWSWIRNFYKVDSYNNEVLYLPRIKSESRGILNSKSLHKFLNKNNVHVFDTSKENFPTQLKKFRDAKLVCSTSGASLINLIFMPAESTLLEITYPLGHSWKFLADLCGIKHISYPITTIKPKKFESTLDTYYVNKNKLNATLQMLTD